jgi:PPK2 family polyphosphate:nucleotide phosphotransferase
MSNNLNLDLSQFKYTGNKTFTIAEAPTHISALYKDKKDYKSLLKANSKAINQYQNKMYADDRYGLLLVFQAMDTAGKDGTISKVLSGVNPHGLVVHAFKKPSDEELDHDYLWRTNNVMPNRGKLHVFNRSYYEEVLIVKVHPKILQYQRIPQSRMSNLEKFWHDRYQDINHMESFQYRNGFPVIKFFLNLSKQEQANRFIDRLEQPDKNWKFSQSDLNERQYWDDYMQAYQNVINATSTAENPWYVIPAGDKMNMRLIVSAIIREQMEKLDIPEPKVSDEKRGQLKELRERLKQGF